MNAVGMYHHRHVVKMRRYLLKCSENNRKKRLVEKMQYDTWGGDVISSQIHIMHINKAYVNQRILQVCWLLLVRVVGYCWLVVIVIGYCCLFLLLLVIVGESLI